MSEDKDKPTDSKSPDSKSGSKPDAKPSDNAKSKPDAKPKASEQPETKPEAKPETKSAAKSEAKPETKPEAKAAAKKSDEKSEPKAEPKSEPKAASASKSADKKDGDVAKDVEVKVEDDSKGKKASGHGHGAPVDPDQPVNADYQDNDIQLDTVRRFMFGSLGVTLVFFVLMLIVHRIYTKGFSKERGVATEETRQIPRRDQALLQTDELVDLDTYLAQQGDQLSQPRETETGQRTIPIEEAMQNMIAQGAFPTATPAPEGQMAARPAPTQRSQPSAPAAPSAPSAPETATGETASAPAEVLDPEMVAAGKALWEANCVICHSGPGGIGPHILHAFGTMRELENADPILMDDWYVRNSMNNPNEHIAKGYQAIMPTQFKTQFSKNQKTQIIEYLKSEGPNPPPMKGEEPEPEPTPEPAPEPAVEAEPTPVPATTPVTPQPAPAEPARPTPQPAPVQPAPMQPAPQPQPAPAEPTPVPERSAPIFI
ncbi:MAG: c-type cytochrome [Verrucomicrobia bacterium]|nr:c-type cytochrome [Verrucomicrobiota bacterium]